MIRINFCDVYKKKMYTSLGNTHLREFWKHFVCGFFRFDGGKQKFCVEKITATKNIY